ncbi:MAG TPA: 30S ribosome-binding factor RbfA [Acetobacteraceae bacterium]|nr:30S ribosome-binding factor RbfA [Acetobacteraceae bacterium]
MKGGRARAASGAPSQRQLRVAEEVRHVLAGLFARGGFRDPELADVQVTVAEVRMSPDLRQATVFVSRLGRGDAAALLPALGRAAAYLRGEVARAVRLRVAPELHFSADVSLDAASRIEALLRAPEVARDLDPTPARTEVPHGRG